MHDVPRHSCRGEQPSKISYRKTPALQTAEVKISVTFYEKAIAQNFLAADSRQRIFGHVSDLQTSGLYASNAARADCISRATPSRCDRERLGTERPKKPRTRTLETNCPNSIVEMQKVFFRTAEAAAQIWTTRLSPIAGAIMEEGNMH